MVTVAEAAGLLILIGLNTAIAAVLTRLFRVRLKTRWGSVLYTLVLTPVALVVVTLILGQLLGPNLDNTAAVLGLTILVPLTLGVAIDYFWMPAPDDVNVPDTI